MPVLSSARATSDIIINQAAPLYLDKNLSTNGNILISAPKITCGPDFVLTANKVTLVAKEICYKGTVKSTLLNYYSNSSSIGRYIPTGGPDQNGVILGPVGSSLDHYAAKSDFWIKLVKEHQSNPKLRNQNEQPAWTFITPTTNLSDLVTEVKEN